MPAFHDWLTRVLAHGESVLAGPPVLADGERPAVLAALRDAYAVHALDVAGPPLPLDEPTALWAAEVLATACWHAAVGEDAGRLRGREPATPAEHLSADLLLRFLPGVYTRARARGLSNLVDLLATLFRRWPLSGVLAGLTDGPVGSVEFGGHAGLQLLYAERQVEAGQTAWVPADGRTLERLEQVYRERGRPLPARPTSPTPEGTHVD
jgi:hypothetical protein